jgi:aldehyde dehydrogenase (NAD+)
MLEDCRDDLLDALHDDLGKERVESAGTELHLVKAEIDVALKSLRRWMRPEKVGAPAVLMPSFHRIEKRPLLGPACLIIGPFNYPGELSS